MARIFIVDGTTYPDPGPEVTPDQFKQMMAGFHDFVSNALIGEAEMLRRLLKRRIEDRIFNYYLLH